MILFVIFQILFTETSGAQWNSMNYNTDLIQLMDNDLKDIVYSNQENIFILFFNSEDLTHKELLKDWRTAAGNLKAQKINVTLAVIDLNTQRSFYQKLLIDKVPCALYFRAGLFNKYTGPFDSESIILTVTEKLYLNLPNYVSPRSYNIFGYILKIFTHGIQGEWSMAINIGIIALTFLGVIVYAIYSYFSIKEKSD